MTVGNISLSELTIKVEQTKFYKSRLVPFGDQLAKEIEAYLPTLTVVGGSKTKALSIFRFFFA